MDFYKAKNVPPRPSGFGVYYYSCEEWPHFVDLALARCCLSHSPPGKNQLSSLSFSLSLKRRWGGHYRGKWLEQDWPNRRDQERRRGICNEDYLKTSEMERAENVPILIAKIALLSKGPDGGCDRLTYWLTD